METGTRLRYAAEQRARRGDGVAPHDPNFSEEEAEKLAGGVPPKKGVPQRWWNAFLPIFGLIAGFIPLLFYSGAKQAPWGGVGWDASSRRIIGNADSYGVLVWAGTFAILFQIVLYGLQWSKEWGGCLLTPSEVIQAAIEGTKDLVETTIVLIRVEIGPGRREGLLSLWTGSHRRRGHDADRPWST